MLELSPSTVMFQFSAPSTRLKFCRTNSKDLLKSEYLLDSFPVHSVQIFVPSSKAYKEKYEDILISDECTYFMVKDATVACLIQHAFLEHFVKSGLLLGITNNARIGVENFLSIIPTSKLVLSLERNIAQSLALHKENQKKKDRKRLFETIIIDLTCPELIPGKKHYQFIASELQKIDYLKFSLLLRWKPSGNACPQSVKSYFESQGFKCTAFKPKNKSSFKYSAPVPKMNFEMMDTDIINDFLEWTGVHICGLENFTEDNEYVSKFTIPETFETVHILHKVSFEGFYSKADILPIIKEMSDIFEKDSSLPFIALCLCGFQDSFVQANGFQFFSSDDKFIYIIIFPSSNYWLITLNCS